MNRFKIASLIIVCYSIYINGVIREQLPNPKLDSAQIEWWFPAYINPPKLHITLTTFEIGNIWKGINDATPRETARAVGREYQKTKKALIDAQTRILNEQYFSLLFPQDKTFSLTGLDIISTHPDFANSFVLDTSHDNFSGTQTKLIKFKKIIEDGTAFQKELIKTRSGQVEAPIFRWHLVVKVDSNFPSFRNKLCSNQLFRNKDFPQSEKYAYLPHITLGRIDSIQDFDVFIALIKLANCRISSSSIQSKTLKLYGIDGNISNEVLQLKSKKLDYTNWFEKNDNQTYFLLDSTKNNLLFMIVIGWKTITGKFLKKIVKIFPEQEKTVKEEVLKDSVTSFSQLYLSIHSLEALRV